MKKALLICITLSTLIACSSLKLSPEEKAIRISQVRQDIENDHYTIEVNQMKPLRGKNVNLSSIYDLTVRNDSAIAYLPFFGRATHAPFATNDGGIKFAQRMENYQKSILSNDKGWSITFDINTGEYNYKFRITVFENGDSTIDVTSIQRDAIFFSGEIKWTNRTSN